MTDPVTADNHSTETTEPEPDPRARRRMEALLVGGTLTLAAVALAWLIRLLIVRTSTWEEWALQLVLVAGAGASAGWASLRMRRTWTLPTNQLVALVPQVKSGELPIESLSEISNGPAVLVPVIQDLLRELRRTRGNVAAMEKEMGHRVASRTDALERALGSMKQQAVRDALTGLFNRRMLDEHLPRLVDQRKADRGELSLLMIDVDNFKMLNDTLGHAAGDELLRSIGQLIRSSIRDSDFAFRCGGDEFIVLLDGCDNTAAQRLADRLTSLVDGLAKPLRVPRPPRLSIGISSLSDLKILSSRNLLEEADRALDEIKGARKRKAG